LDLKETVLEGMDMFDAVQDMDQKQALINMVTDL
jgi:hypothetical protein